MQQRYLDNASTTFPKPKEVAEAVYQYITQNGSNINRGCYSSAYCTEELVFDTRQLICDLFHGTDCKNVVFTKNITESLNIVLKGFLKPHDHVLVSSMEHNAVMRPLVQLQKQGVQFSRIPCNDKGELCADPLNASLETLLTPQTKAIVMTHASNVCGTVMPLQKVGDFCQRHGLAFIVDCAQTAGVLPIDVQAMHIDALAFTGHKGLLAPQGIGGFLLAESMINRIEPLLSGGTGSISHTEEIPTFMPDRFEAGTLPLACIMGLRASLLWLKQMGLERIQAHELDLTQRFLQGLLPLERAGLVKIIGKHDCNGRIGVVSIQTRTRDLSEAAFELEERYGILTRVGLQCAPSAHKTLNTYPTGVLRFSFGWWNTVQDVQVALTGLEAVCRGL